MISKINLNKNKMKRNLLALVAFLVVGNVLGQDISKTILGKWKLKTLEVDGSKLTPQDAFQTSEVFQVYAAKGVFTGVIGTEQKKGNWKASKNQKEISITTDGKKSVFKVLSFKSNKMTLKTKIDGQLITLHYKRVKEGAENKVSDMAILDANRDGVINPYEALDVLLLMQKEKGKIATDDIAEIVASYHTEQQKENDDIFKDVDKNKNNIIEMNEAPEEMVQFLQMMDTDGSRSVSKEEMNNFNFEKAIFPGEAALKQQAKEILKQFSGGKAYVVIKDAPAEVQGEVVAWDSNEDGKLNENEIFKGLESGASTAKFEVKGDVAYMNGTISSSTPAAVLELIFQHPEVKTIEMLNVPGSIDDVANLRASLYVHKFGLNTRLNSKSMIASGGTDFFLAGKKRTIAKGAKIGVHSWGGGATAATDLPKSDEAHQKYLDYYTKINIPTEFYWYTLKAAPASSIHNMTEEEIKKYKVRNN